MPPGHEGGIAKPVLLGDLSLLLAVALALRLKDCLRAKGRCSEHLAANRRYAEKFGEASQ